MCINNDSLQTMSFKNTFRYDSFENIERSVGWSHKNGQNIKRMSASICPPYTLIKCITYGIVISNE